MTRTQWAMALTTIVIALMFLGCSEQAPVSPENSYGVPLTRLAADPRLAVVGEAILSITGWDGIVNRAINGNAVSDWNYYADDLNAYSRIKNWYQTDNNASIMPTYYNNINEYGLQGGYGRGGQCRAYANLILYRSGTYQTCLLQYNTLRNDYYGARTKTKDVSKVLVGDLIQSKTNNGHTAIVVKIMAGVAGSSVTSVDVIDANWVGGKNNEIIGRHVISVLTSGSNNGTLSDLDSYFAIDLIKLGAR